MATTAAARSIALGFVDRLARALVGLIAGTVVGVMTAELAGTLLAIWLPLPKVWAAWLGCAAGAGGASWLALSTGAPWIRARTRRSRRTAHGWVDLAFRAALGVVVGLSCGALTASAALVWLDVLGPQWRGSLDADPFLRDAEGLLLVVLGMLLGALAGLVWFAADLPWLPGRRTQRAHAAGTRDA